MNTLIKKNIVGLAVTAALGFGLAGQAQAAPFAYAVAENQVQDFLMSLTNATFSAPATVTDSAATRFGAGIAFADATDAPHSFLGATDPGENAGPIGRVGDYERGDAQIIDANVLAGTGSAWNIAESFTAFNTLGTGFGGNTLTGEINIAEGSLGSVAFSFDASPYIEVEVSADATTPPSFATAELAFSITLVNQDTNDIVYSWVPVTDDLNNIEGNLNAGLTAHSGEFLVQNQARDMFSYSNSTGLLDPGNYNLTIAMSERVAQTAVAVPLPATFLLMGAGLAGLGMSRRKRPLVACV